MKVNDVITENRQPVLILPVGVSGAGKSTLYKKLKAQNPEMEVFSLDMLRHEWYDAKDYEKAWKAASEDPEFANKANQHFLQMIKSGKDVYVDNTNLTPKRRKFYINEARRNGYRVVAYNLPVDLETLIARQETRGDKKVPPEAVRQQYMSLKPATRDEADDVITVKGN